MSSTHFLINHDAKAILGVVDAPWIRAGATRVSVILNCRESGATDGQINSLLGWMQFVGDAPSGYELVVLAGSLHAYTSDTKEKLGVAQDYSAFTLLADDLASFQDTEVGDLTVRVEGSEVHLFVTGGEYNVTMVRSALTPDQAASLSGALMRAARVAAMARPCKFEIIPTPKESA